MHVRGQRICGNVLYLALNSAANLKLLLKKVLIFLKKGDDADLCLLIRNNPQDIWL